LEIEDSEQTMFRKSLSKR